MQTEFLILEIDVLTVIGARFRGCLESLNQWVRLCLDCVPNLNFIGAFRLGMNFYVGFFQADFPPAGFVSPDRRSSHC